MKTTLLFFVLVKMAKLTSLDCEVAHTLCIHNVLCYSVMRLLPILCGNEIVVCASTTSHKCRAALNTLTSFSFFQPTCLCKQAHHDLTCSTLRQIIFDHPCTLSSKNIRLSVRETLPTCDYSYRVCQLNTMCKHTLDSFVLQCTRHNHSCNINRQACSRLWPKVKLSLVFGCICSDLNDSSCLRVFNMIYDNPCVESASVSANWLLHISPAALPRISASALRTNQYVPFVHTSTSSSKFAAHLGARYRLQDNHILAVNNVDNPLSTDANEVQNNYTVTHLLLDNLKQRTNLNSRFINDSENNETKAKSGDHTRESHTLHLTCQKARGICHTDKTCANKLNQMINRCRFYEDSINCDIQACLQGVQNFYTSIAKSKQEATAFCVCRHDDMHSGCSKAMNELHPTCLHLAENTSSRVSMMCHHVREQCLRHNLCSRALQSYSQHCAVDTLTDTCALSTEQCRRAVLQTMGTLLRVRCHCEIHSPTELSLCLQWRQFLWNNPCVVVAQKEYHIDYNKKVESKKINDELRANNLTQKPSNRMRFRNVVINNDQYYSQQISSTHSWRSSSSSKFMTTPHSLQTEWKSRSRVYDNKSKHCEVRNLSHINYLRLGSSVRYYEKSPNGLEETKECSHLCTCIAIKQLTCTVLFCSMHKSCVSPMAKYPHGSVALLAHRDKCICYYGDFICVKPHADEYTLPFGTFLFLGYSKQDDSVMSAHTGKSILTNLIEELQKMIRLGFDHNGKNINDWPCKLHILRYFQSSQNVIVQAKHQDVEKTYNRSLNMNLIHLENEICSRPLNDLSYMINNQFVEITSHPILSSIKISSISQYLPHKSGAIDQTICQLSLPFAVSIVLFCLL